MRNKPPVSPLLATLGVVAVAFGLGVAGAYVLDFHGHTCTACGYRWNHLGAFNVGDEKAHACKCCGTIQWWKDGATRAHRELHL